MGDRYKEEQIAKAIDLFHKGEQKEGGDEQEKGVAVAPWEVSEIGELCRFSQAGPGADGKVLKKAVANNIKSLRGALGEAVDIARSGRMATSGLMASVDGAMVLAHIITTHPVEADIDWFTAVGDLASDEGDKGAGRLNTQEFSSGDFYRYPVSIWGSFRKTWVRQSAWKWQVMWLT